MKKIIIILVILHASLFTVHPVVAQFGCSCLPEGISFTTQEQIESFQVYYPGCSVILGDVEIKWDISNLIGLNVLTSIGGDLRIYENPFGPACLTGLDNLASVGGTLQIGNEYESWGQNDSLNSLTGLENLSSIGGDLIIARNYSLSDLSGLDNLVTVGGNLTIAGNYGMYNIAGLANLTSISGALTIYGNGITSLNGLQNINPATITDLKIYDNYQLVTCEIQPICYYLEHPNGSVDIYSNGPGCDNPAGIAGNCGISLPCLPFGNYYFMSQADIDNFASNFPDCTDLNGNVSITGNDVVNLNGLNQITSISGDFKLGCYGYGEGGVGNPLLLNLSGLENLSRIGGSFWIVHRNESLVSLEGLGSLSYIGGDFLMGVSFIYTPSRERGFPLANIESLGNLDSIGGQLLINGTALEDFTGLENLTSIGSALEIYSNDTLSCIAALSNLSSIGGHLAINYNDVLASLAGLENINPNSIKSLYILENDSLSMCDVQSICESFAIADSNTWISQNATGCNSQEEVEAACTVGIGNPQIQRLKFKVQSYPNPFSSFTTLEYELDHSASVNLSIYNHLGQQVAMLADGEKAVGKHQVQWDAEGLPAGIYFYRLSTVNCQLPTASGKLVKY